MNPPICLSIAGVDNTGGAGLQADQKTFMAHGCYGMSVITALPIQNTQGVRKIHAFPIDWVADQLAAVFDDIQPDCIKLGMLFSAPVIACVSDMLQKYAPQTPIVLDPVMVSASGDLLLDPDAVAALVALMPMTTIITPNRLEAAALLKHTEASDFMALRTVLGVQALLVTNSQPDGDLAEDTLIWEKGLQYLRKPRLETPHTHGTGCTLSASICAHLARGMSLFSACQAAKDYIDEALRGARDWQIGHGQGPVKHFHEAVQMPLI